jgi:hypothetical protein
VSLPIEVLLAANQERNYDISTDGKQFLVTSTPEQLQSGDPASLRINTVVNWFSELKNHVPVE